MILNDKTIIELVKRKHMITPFVADKQSNGVISYGLSSFGYDIRVSNKFKIFTNLKPTVLDPKHIDHSAFIDHTGDYCFIPPNSFALACSVEWIKMPSDITGIVLGKSTYARCGICMNFTPLEAGWAGNITIEISNTTTIPAKIYANEGIAQILFFQGEDCDMDYAKRGGTYQNQIGITLPIIRNI